MTGFEAALAHVLREEGGLIDHPKDPGGRTNLGITQRKLDEVRAARPGYALPGRVDDLLPEDAGTIYRLEYWLPIRGDDLPTGLALAVFDGAVNAGVGQSAKWLQRAVGVKADGVIGAQTIAAISRAPDSNELLREFMARRAHHYMLLDSLDDDFGLGWARRLFRTYDAALGLA